MTDTEPYGLPKRRSRGARAKALFLAAGLFVILSGTITQWMAGELGGGRTLGVPHFSVDGMALYAPFSWIGWTQRLRDRTLAGQTRQLGVLSLCASVLFGIWVMKRLTKSRSLLHGSARWAQRRDLIESGLLTGKRGRRSGVYVGAWRDPKRGTVHYLRHNGPEHILAFAPTRSGKGVGLVIPTLLSWPESVVVLDLKGENWEVTSGWRQREARQDVLRFDPTDPESVQFNPLCEIRLRTEHETADIQNIATMLVDPHGKGLTDHWARTAWSLLVGAITHVCYREARVGSNASLEMVAAELTDPSASYDQVMERWLVFDHDPLGEQGWEDGYGVSRTHPLVAAAAREMLNRDPREASSVLSSAGSHLTLYRDPLVARATRRSDFMICDLMNHERPVSLYLVIRPTDKDRLRPLVRLILTQILRRLAERIRYEDGEPVSSHKHRLLLLLDEFASLGKLPVFEEALAYIGGYGIKAYLIVQDLSQLYAAYGKSESIVANCHLRVAFAPNKVETAEILSKMTGTTTATKKQSGGKGSNKTTQEFARPLLTADECMRLRGPKKDEEGRIERPGDMLVFAAGFCPIYGRQLLYFQDLVFGKRAKHAPAVGGNQLCPSGTAPWAPPKGDLARFARRALNAKASPEKPPSSIKKHFLS